MLKARFRSRINKFYVDFKAVHDLSVDPTLIRRVSLGLLQNPVENSVRAMYKDFSTLSINGFIFSGTGVPLFAASLDMMIMSVRTSLESDREAIAQLAHFS